MRLHYISFFYYNIILLFFIILKIDLLFYLFLIFRKSYSIYKESLIEYFFQDFDGLRKDQQSLDLYENKLYLDFGLDVGLEDAYTQQLYMTYALYGLYLDFEAYKGYCTFKWNDFNIEELNFKNKKNQNFKKLFLNIDEPYIHFWINMRQKLNSNITEDDYTNIYSYRSIHKRDYEDFTFLEENEKNYYNFLKAFFLKDNFYDIYVDNNYFNNLNYSKLLSNLKKKVFLNKYIKVNNDVYLKNSLSLLEININDNINFDLKK